MSVILNLYRIDTINNQLWVGDTTDLIIFDVPSPVYITDCRAFRKR